MMWLLGFLLVCVFWCWVCFFDFLLFFCVAYKVYFTGCLAGQLIFYWFAGEVDDLLFF